MRRITTVYQPLFSTHPPSFLPCPPRRPPLQPRATSVIHGEYYEGLTHRCVYILHTAKRATRRRPGCRGRERETERERGSLCAIRSLYIRSLRHLYYIYPVCTARLVNVYPLMPSCVRIAIWIVNLIPSDHFANPLRAR